MMLLAVLCFLLTLPAWAFAPLENLGVGSSGNWRGAVYCAEHRHLLADVQSSVTGRSPAVNQLLAGMYGLLLFGPEFRFTVQFLARGEFSDDGRVLHGDLVLRGLHPVLMREEELWKAGRAVKRIGLHKIHGRVFWELTVADGAMAPVGWPLAGSRGRHLRLKELETKLQLIGVQMLPPADQFPPDAAGEREILSYETRPLSLLLRRDLGLLRALLPGQDSWKALLGEVGVEDWLLQDTGRLNARDVIVLLSKSLAHGQVGSDLAASLQPLKLGALDHTLRGLLIRDRDITELIGMTELEGHSSVLLSLRIEGQTSDQELERILGVLLRPGGFRPEPLHSGWDTVQLLKAMKDRQLEK